MDIEVISTKCTPDVIGRNGVHWALLCSLDTCVQSLAAT